MKETIQASRAKLEVRTEAEGGGWAEESLGIIKMIVYCTHVKMYFVTASLRSPYCAELIWNRDT